MRFILYTFQRVIIPQSRPSNSHFPKLLTYFATVVAYEDILELRP
jgi:hypothetical protein